MKICLVIPTRNNLKYTKWSYNSIRKNQGDHQVNICYGLDACTDGTREWVQNIKQSDPYVYSIENTGQERVGLTVMYNRIVNELVMTDVAMLFHADMYLCPGALDEVEKLMYDTNSSARNLKRIVSLTRIEPALHPEGAEKIVKEYGMEPENFNEEYLLKFVEGKRSENLPETNGVFAPWAFWTDEFKEIGGHDLLFAPSSKEDSDIFNRFKLNGTEFLQTWKGFVYHLTCRGSRFNPNITTLGQNSAEWLQQNERSHRNFIRKWGTPVLHDRYLHPIVPPKYNIEIILTNGSYELLRLLEPHCVRTYCVDLPQAVIDLYQEREQPNTSFNLEDRLQFGSTHKKIALSVKVDGKYFTQEDYQNLCNLPLILSEQNNDEPLSRGQFALGNIRVEVVSTDSIPHEIVANNAKE